MLTGSINKAILTAVKNKTVARPLDVLLESLAAVVVVVVLVAVAFAVAVV